MITVMFLCIMSCMFKDYKSVECEIDDLIKKIKAAMKQQGTFLETEKNLRAMIFELACSFLKLYLTYNSYSLSIVPYLSGNEYRRKSKPVKRTLKTSFGKVLYKREYLIRKNGGNGIYPLDMKLGILSDGFSPYVIDLCCRLSTRMSFKASLLVFEWFNGWSPSSESAECLVLGIGRKAGQYMDVAPVPDDDGEILVIEIDGKATPTATDEELEKRRRPRNKKKCRCGCQRHRGKSKRSCKVKTRKKKGDKSKNGRSITLVAMYTLRKGDDGKLHGPINKKIWGSYNSRKVMFEWVRNQAERRGFPSITSENIQFVMDGERCLERSLREIFPKARFTLDVRHLEEKIWDVGRLYHKEGSEDLVATWVAEHKELLYEGKEKDLLLHLIEKKNSLSKRAKRDQKKITGLEKLIFYMKDRIPMMGYKELIEKDMVIASGIIEGAARYVVGKRMDCSGMRWIMGRAEALLHLRCIELNGDWEKFYGWTYGEWMKSLRDGKSVRVRSTQPIPIDKAVS